MSRFAFPWLVAVLMLAGACTSNRTDTRVVITGRVQLTAIPGLNDMSRVRIDIGRGEGGVVPDADGQFELSDLEPDVYTLVITFTGGLTPQASRSAYRRHELRVVGRSGGDINLGTLVLQLATGRVTGRVEQTDGRDPAGATASLRTMDGKTLQAPVTGGLYVLESVPVGEHSVTVTKPLYAAGSAQPQCAPLVAVVEEDAVVEATPMVLAPTAVGLVPGAVGILDTEGTTWYLQRDATGVAVRVLSTYATQGRVWLASGGTLSGDGGVVPFTAFQPDGYVVDVPDGRSTVLLQFADRCGYESPVYSLTIIRDRTAPRLDLVMLNGGAPFITAPTTRMLVVATDELDGPLELRRALCTVPALGAVPQCTLPLEASPWDAYQADDNVTFDPQQGGKAVQVQVRDRSGNVSEIATALVTLDSLPPVNPLVVIGNGSELVSTNRVVVTVQAEGATRMKVGPVSGLAGVAWQPMVATFPVDLPGTDGEKRVYAVFADDAGNETGEVSGRAVLDATPPSAPLVTLGDPASAPWVSDAYAPLVVLTTDDDRATLTLRLRGDTAGGARDYGWSAIPSHVDLAKGDGSKRVLASLVDRAGNESPVTETVVQLDTLAPLVRSVVVNNGAEYTGAALLVLALDVTGAAEMRIQCDGAFDTETWGQAAADADCPAPVGDGLKTVRGMFRDAAGNTVTVTARPVVLDTLGPAGTLEVAGLTSTSTGFRTREPFVDLLMTALDPPAGTRSGSGTRWMKVWNGSGSEPADWLEFRPSMRWQLPTGDGPKEIHLKLADGVGNPSTTAITASLTLDQTPPTLPRLAALPAATSAAAVLPALDTPSTDVHSAPVTYQLRVDPSSPTWTTVTFPLVTPVPLAAGERNLVRLRSLDAAGNVSAEDAAAVVQDATGPREPVLLVSRQHVNATTASVTIVNPDPDDAGLRFEGCTENIPATATCSRTCTPVDLPSSVVLSLSAGGKTCVFARSVDAAQNASGLAVTWLISDLSAPRPPDLAPRFDPSALTVRAPRVDLFLAGPATDLPLGGPGNPYKGVAHLEVDDGAGFSPLCPGFITDEAWDPCRAVSPCTDPRLRCTGTTPSAVNVALVAGLANRVAVRAVDLAGNVGDGVSQVIATESDEPAGLAAGSQEAPHLWGTTLAWQTRNTGFSVVELGTNRRVDTTDPQCGQSTFGSFRVTASPGAAGVAYLDGQDVKLRRRGADGLLCTADDPADLVLYTSPAGALKEVSLSGGRVAFVETAYDVPSRLTTADVRVKEAGPDGVFGTTDDTTVVVSHSTYSGNDPSGLSLAGACLLWSGPPSSDVDGWQVVCTASSFASPLGSHSFTAAAAALAADGLALVRGVFDPFPVPTLWLHRRAAGTLFNGTGVRRDYPAGAATQSYGWSVAVDGVHVASLEQATEGALGRITDWNAGPDGAFGSGDDDLRRLAPASVTRLGASLAGGLLVFSSGGDSARDILSMDLTTMRWESVGTTAAHVHPVLNGAGTLVFQRGQDLVARSPSGRETVRESVGGAFSGHGMAASGEFLLLAEAPPSTPGSPQPTLFRAGTDGLFFTDDDPAPAVHDIAGTRHGAYLGGGKGMVVHASPVDGLPEPVVLEPGTGPLELATQVSLGTGCSEGANSYWGGISRRHAMWDSGNWAICIHDAGPDEEFGTGDDLPSAKLGSWNNVRFAWMDERRMVINTQFTGELSVVDTGPDGRFNTADDVTTPIPLHGRQAMHVALAGNALAYVATPSGTEGAQVYLHDLATGRATQLTSHHSSKWTSEGYAMQLAVDASGRTVWTDTLFPYPSLFVHIP
ncbi:MAG: hypothetical protein HY904_13450 [Deltaproteobacteria bacterium]|nr:hypothetical protein [Deltaproteobacteria bacterium]